MQGTGKKTETYEDFFFIIEMTVRNQSVKSKKQLVFLISKKKQLIQITKKQDKTKGKKRKREILHYSVLVHQMPHKTELILPPTLHHTPKN